MLRTSILPVSPCFPKELLLPVSSSRPPVCPSQCQCKYRALLAVLPRKAAKIMRFSIGTWVTEIKMTKIGRR